MSDSNHFAALPLAVPDIPVLKRSKSFDVVFPANEIAMPLSTRRLEAKPGGLVLGWTSFSWQFFVDELELLLEMTSSSDWLISKSCIILLPWFSIDLTGCVLICDDYLRETNTDYHKLKTQMIECQSNTTTNPAATTNLWSTTFEIYKLCQSGMIYVKTNFEMI